MKVCKKILPLIILYLNSNLLFGQNIYCAAGTGNQGYSGDFGLALSAHLNTPQSIAIDALGELYVGCEHVIRKINAAGIITTFAGTGSPGSTGDGGLAVAANISSPGGMAFDALGNLYIADVYNHKIRKVSTNGIISTIAGNGNPSFSGDGGLATLAELKFPSDVFVDNSGNLYIADMGNARIRMINSIGIITTVAGTTSGYSGDGGLASLAQLNSPKSVVVDNSGNIYISDNGNNRIRKINSLGIINTVAGTGGSGYSGDGGQATLAQIGKPNKLRLDVSGNIYFSDVWNSYIRKVSGSGIISTVSGNGTFNYSGDGGPAIAASINSPMGIAFDSIGNMYFGDANNHRVRIICFGNCVMDIEENHEINKLNMYPNPTSTELNILFSNSYHAKSIELINISGIVLESFSGNTSQINVEELDQGMYFIKIKNDNETLFYSKFIKQ